MTNRDQAWKQRQRLAQLRRWWRSPLGKVVAEIEHRILARLLRQVFGHYLVVHARQGGAQAGLDGCMVKHQIWFDDAVSTPGSHPQLRASAEALPFMSDGVDALVLSHTLEYSTDPHQVLREAERILIPEGYLLVVGFNPWSLWGMLGRMIGLGRRLPWVAQGIGVNRVKDWLSLLGFSVEHEYWAGFRPPIKNTAWLARLEWLERFGRRWLRPLGGVYIVMAKKQVVILTPLKQRWRRRPLLPGGVTEPTAREGSLRG